MQSTLCSRCHQHSIVYKRMCLYCYGAFLQDREAQRRAQLGSHYHVPVIPYSVEHNEASATRATA